MQDNRPAMAMELRQIIQTDRLAVDIIQRAEDTRKKIENKTKTDIELILSDAQKKKQEIAQQVQEEQKRVLAQRKQEAGKAFRSQRLSLNRKMKKNQENWVAQITARITNSPPAK